MGGPSCVTNKDSTCRPIESCAGLLVYAGGRPDMSLEACDLLTHRQLARLKVRWLPGCPLYQPMNAPGRSDWLDSTTKVRPSKVSRFPVTILNI